MSENNNSLENHLWDAADELRANSNLSSAQYSGPVLGLIFLCFADHKFAQAEAELEGQGTGRRQIGPSDYIERIGFNIPDEARFEHLQNLPEGEDIGKAINEAMKSIETENADNQGQLFRHKFLKAHIDSGSLRNPPHAPSTAWLPLLSLDSKFEVKVQRGLVFGNTPIKVLTSLTGGCFHHRIAPSENY